MVYPLCFVCFRLSEIDDLKRSLEETCEDQKHEVRSLQSKVSEHERDEQNTQQIEAKYKKLRNKLEDANKELEETKLRLVFTWAHEPRD